MFAQSILQVTGDIQRYNSADEDNFTQCGIFFRDVLNKDEKERLVDNIASHICNAQDFLQVHLDPKNRITKKCFRLYHRKRTIYNTISSFLIGSGS